jgi:transaldolase/glucose-6-phosphate isomerase
MTGQSGPYICLSHGKTDNLALPMDAARRILPPDLESDVNRLLDNWQTGDRVARLWSGDVTLWSGSDEAQWLGWMKIVEQSLSQLDELQAFAQEVRDAGIIHVVLLGMGGSSMAPEVFSETFNRPTGYPELLVLDSIHPAQISAVEAAVDLAHTLFIVSSKSGSSLEPNILADYFYQLVVHTVGAADAGNHFIAITDPGTCLEARAGREGFRHVFHGEPSIGGRFSALSNFGLLPAALIGVDCRQLLESAQVMVDACSQATPVADNPGVVLGCIMGAAADAGRDKLTLVISPRLASIGAWLEQLVAESTGKQGKGIIPVDGETVIGPADYGNDRLFVYLRLQDDPDPAQDTAVASLEAAGQPVVRIDVPGVHALGGEFFRWEMATAVTGSVLGINPFDQPDVEASKVESRSITTICETGGDLPGRIPLAAAGELVLYADEANAAALTAACGEGVGMADILQAHLARLGPGDYFAILAYLDRNMLNTRRLDVMRHAVRRAHRVATCLGFGPRFLHSTGQAHKGGANNGVFLQVTADADLDLQAPGHSCPFGVVAAAQSCGDFEVMAARHRRILRVHLGADADAGLDRLVRLISRENQ